MKQQHFLLQGVELMAVGEATLLAARAQITGCAACSESASSSLERLLQDMSGSLTTDFFLSGPIHCPRCSSPVFERTLIDWNGNSSESDDDCKYFDSCDENQDVVFIDQPMLMEAQSFIGACEHCSDVAELPFDQLLDSLTGCDPSTTEYIICHAAKCKACDHDVTEKTLVLPC